MRSHRALLFSVFSVYLALFVMARQTPLLSVFFFFFCRTHIILACFSPARLTFIDSVSDFFPFLLSFLSLFPFCFLLHFCLPISYTAFFYFFPYCSLPSCLSFFTWHFTLIDSILAFVILSCTIPSSHISSIPAFHFYPRVSSSTVSLSSSSCILLFHYQHLSKQKLNSQLSLGLI